MLTNFIADFLVPQIALDSKSLFLQRFDDVGRVIGLVFGDREDTDLDRRQPDGQVTAVVLDQQTDEALETADDGAMQHHRKSAAAGLRHVVGVEALLVGQPTISSIATLYQIVNEFKATTEQIL